MQQSESNIDVSVVIVSYRVPHLLKQALATLFAFNKKCRFEVIVIDNASNDETELLLRQNFPQVKAIFSRNNLGFPAANNIGFRMAAGKYIFMLNPDTEFISPLVDELFSFMEEHTEVILAAPKLLNSDKSHQISAWRFPNLLSASLDLLHLNFLNKSHFYFDKNPEFNSFEAESLSGAALFFRKNSLEKLAGLDETMFWIEDVEFCYRMQLEGYKKMYLHQLNLIHHSGQSAKKNYNISVSNQIFNKIKYFQKHKSQLETLFIKLLSLLHVLVKILVFSVMSPFSKIKNLKRQAYIYTLKKVLHPPSGIA
jgi:GT2 family glycosyltransferase